MKREEIEKLESFSVFTPVLKSKTNFEAPLFNHTWVDKLEKSRLACCDYNTGEER